MVSSRGCRPYTVTWSDEDHEYVATHSGYPSLCWLESDPQDALEKLIGLISKIESDLESKHDDQK